MYYKIKILRTTNYRSLNLSLNLMIFKLRNNIIRIHFLIITLKILSKTKYRS